MRVACAWLEGEPVSPVTLNQLLTPAETPHSGSLAPGEEAANRVVSSPAFDLPSIPLGTSQPHSRLTGVVMGCCRECS